MVKCPNCGGETKYNPKEKKVTCDYCNSKFEPKELRTIINLSKEVKKLDATSYTCSQCGATLLVFDDTAITFCNYCGSNALVNEKMKINNPDYVIPFKITKEEAIKAYRRKIGRSLLVPRSFKLDTTVEKFRGIYMPYCIYDMGYEGDVSSRGSVKYLHLFGYDYYHDYKVSAQIKANYDGFSYDLASKFYDKYSMALPFQYKDVEEFNLNYMSGYYADSKDIDIDTYDTQITKIARNDARNELSKKRSLKFASHGCTVPTVPVSIENRKIGMFPVYFLAMVNKDKDIVHYAVVNGQTGKVAMDMPIDYKKYILLSLLLAVPAYFLISTGPLVQPKTVTFIGMLFSVMSLFLSNSQLDAIKRDREHLDDKGYQIASDDRKVKMKFTERYIKHNWKQTISFLISFLAAVSGTIEDTVYYGAAILSLLFVLWAFHDLVIEHNELSSSKLPQLEKRGGDENA